MASENEGLDLFDETASAAGSFPTAAWGGYNKASVDEYLRSLENQIADLKRVQRDLRRTVEQQRIELDKPVQMDFTNLGSHTTQILSTAEAQAREITDRANSQAEQMLAETRQQAADLRNAAQQDADDLRTTTLADARRLRERWDAETHEIVERCRAEADALVATAGQHAEAVKGQADAHAEMMRTGAEVEARTILAEAERVATEARETAAAQAATTVADAEEDARRLRGDSEEQSRATLTAAEDRSRQLLAQAHAEVTRLRDEAFTEANLLRDEARAEATVLRDSAAEEARTIRKQVAEERDASLAALNDELARIRQQTEKLLEDATARHQALVASVEEESERAQQLRTGALAEAEQTKVLAAREGQQIVQQAHNEAEMARQTVADRWEARQSRLRRETDMLSQRKHAILAQLSSLSTLAGTSAEDFPDIEFGALEDLRHDPPIDLPEDEATVVLDRESAERLEAERLGKLPEGDEATDKGPTAAQA